ncbi:polysaccharide pyruvyl transferase family protein [Waterburya agarophytonicola K14]|uniref:Polysaccharide pyruvyl transferase family protein n=1 Tax=Waterburya agarophytonicola KI4 TaxID=2874699 RepID=A0A964BUV9_9CYAN|nr:polysaccharide pyruvyl transferase family protein [Waterburya agarophytonicola]MCC0179589.1 polysaccharide pyruvyl transferase family protein [Waterburya agarophytonicola KI4]
MTVTNANIAKATSQFLFMGNSSYHNRGCEAIVRGTMRILRNSFGDNIQVAAGSYGSAEDLFQQNATEMDRDVHNFLMRENPPRWSLSWWETKANRLLSQDRFAGANAPLKDKLDKIEAALILGGDTYSLDYGLPMRYLRNDHFVLKHQRPLFLWAASVGPFDKNPQFAEQMFEHLQSLTGVFVREEETLNYLADNGVKDNVRFVADPAFVMQPEEPSPNKLGFTIPEDAIGLNFSPLIAKYFLNRNIDAWKISSQDRQSWIDFCTDIVTELSHLTQRSIVLVPHVVHPNVSVDDYQLLKEIKDTAENDCSTPILLVPNTLNGMETKWVIGKTQVFAGARTHSTIAALSSCVPTLTMSFSIKAIGINRDLFNHTDYCLDTRTLNKKEFIERFCSILDNRQSIKNQLLQRVPEVQKRAMQAGEFLKEMV